MRGHNIRLRWRRYSRFVLLKLRLHFGENCVHSTDHFILTKQLSFCRPNVIAVNILWEDDGFSTQKWVRLSRFGVAMPL